ncbi:MAG: hypothetical protein GEU79_10330 [Acidimicrobiia bacterium]|nr:hypothetical protein [Acidimicrobiia bacterium]
MEQWPISPALRFEDLGEALDFYRDKLGFKLEQGEVDEGNLAVSFDHSRMMLEQGSTSFYGDSYNSAIKERIGNQSPNSLYLQSSDVDALYHRYQEAGVKIIDPIGDRPWGQREFTIEDPSGNWLSFWQR